MQITPVLRQYQPIYSLLFKQEITICKVRYKVQVLKFIQIYLLFQCSKCINHNNNFEHIQVSNALVIPTEMMLSWVHLQSSHPSKIRGF